MKILLSTLKYLFIVAIAGSVLVSLVGGLFLLYFARDLPAITAIEDYKPALVTRVVGRDGQTVGEFYEQRRYLLPIGDIPEMVVNSFVAAEDDRFFDHQGVDYLGMMRAAVANFKAGHVVQGGSTITQQVAKSILLSPEKSFTRKIREVIISSRMEKSLTKKEIMYLYLSQIYFGEGSYGVESAAQFYFRKPAKELLLEEAALLAGLPQAPSRYSPLQNPKRAKERQVYVLKRMLEGGKISKEQHDKAINEPVIVYTSKNKNSDFAPYYVEHIRRYVLEKYGQDKLYQGGLVVHTPLDPTLSKRAIVSVKEGLRDVDKRHGYRGPLQKFRKSEEISNATKDIMWSNLLKEKPYKVVLADGTHADSVEKFLIGSSNYKEIYKSGEIYKAIVVSVNDAKKEALLDLGLVKGVITLDGMRWAVPIKAGAPPPSEQLNRISTALSKGDVVLVKVQKNINPTPSTLPLASDSELLSLSLEQDPEVQGALFSMDHHTGEVLAMVGGYEFESSEFNRAIQAERQTGSAYKPVIYAAAIDRGYTPVTIIQDSPLVFSTGDEKWKPLNYDEHFSGDTTLRTALIKSMNIPTIKIVQDIGISYLIDYSKRLGLSKSLNPDFSIALGSSSVSLENLVSLYSIFPRGGRKIKPLYITKIVDRDGQVLEENPKASPKPSIAPVLTGAPKPVLVAGQLKSDAAAEGAVPPEPWTPDPTDADRVMDPRTAYVMTHLMNEVTTTGTGSGAKNLKRVAAGKTGTTNDYMDAWFIGYTPHVSTGVWVGFDTLRSLGPRGTGGGTALPIWLSFMEGAIEGYPDVGFETPPGVAFAYINGSTGKLVNSTTPGAVKEAFIEGTEPTRYESVSRPYAPAQSAGGVSDESHTEDFLKEDLQ